MKRVPTYAYLLPLYLLATLVLAVLPSERGLAEISQNSAGLPRFVEGELLIKYKRGTSSAAINNLTRSIQGKTIRSFPPSSIHHVKLPAGVSVTEMAARLSKHPIIEYAQPNYRYYLNVIPDDPQFGDMWGLNNTGQTGGTPDADIDAPEAWEITKGSSANVIAVIDSGMDLNHPDLAANLWTNPGEIAGNGIDDDGNGYIDDVHGWNFVDNNNDPSPARGGCGGHGTHTAGTIGASGNNGIGVTGVNWNVQIMPLRAFSRFLFIFCSASDADLIEAIQYHTRMGVRISSNSWGGPGFSNAIRDIIRASNSLFVAAAGNSSNDSDVNPDYPAAYDLDNIVSVAATDHNDALAAFSNYGLTTVDLGAPGDAILSTLPNNKYGTFSGTSMATPHVAGVAGLLLAQDPSLTIREMKWRLMKGTDNTGLSVASGGRLNANNSLQYGLSLPAVSAELVPNGPLGVVPGSTLNYQVILTNNDVVNVTTTAKVYVRLWGGFGTNNGKEFSLAGPVDVNIAAGNFAVYDLAVVVPSSFPPGSRFSLYAQSQTSDSFDEDRVTYSVVAAP